jgi:hypothetical protein
MSTEYEQWRDFYAAKITNWMTVGEIREECGRLARVGSPSTEMVLVHAMRELERVQAQRDQLLEALKSVEFMRETLRGIADADWTKWEELASADEFVRWAKARANHALTPVA